jgi:hypothetical protein
MSNRCSELKNQIQNLENKTNRTPEENHKLQSLKNEFEVNCREITDPIQGDSS